MLINEPNANRIDHVRQAVRMIVMTHAHAHAMFDHARAANVRGLAANMLA